MSRGGAMSPSAMFDAIERLIQERDAEKARADAAEKRLADLRTWAENEDAWDGYHVEDVIDEILRRTTPGGCQ